MAQLLLNILIAFLWTLFQDEDTFHLSTFISGYLIGMFIVYLMHRFFGHVFYMKKVWVIFKFICVYNYQLVTSSITTINYILFNRLRYRNYITFNMPGHLDQMVL